MEEITEESRKMDSAVLLIFTCIFSMYFVLINCSCLKLLTGLIGCDYLVSLFTHSRHTHTCINDCLGLRFNRFIHVRDVFIRLVLKMTEY